MLVAGAVKPLLTTPSAVKPQGAEIVIKLLPIKRKPPDGPSGRPTEGVSFYFVLVIKFCNNLDEYKCTNCWHTNNYGKEYYKCPTTVHDAVWNIEQDKRS